MYPEAAIVGQPTVPNAAIFWTPDPPTADEIAQAGEDRLPAIAYFHDAWRICDATLDEAATYLAEERELADAVAATARSAAQFDEMIAIVEGGWVSDPAENLSPPDREALGVLVWDVPPDLGSLELGVAGLSYALNAVGFVTAASCRGHTAPQAWSPVPVVAFAADRDRVFELQKLAQQVGCTFFIDAVRPDLLVVSGRSIRDTMDLAMRIIDNHRLFANESPGAGRTRPEGNERLDTPSYVRPRAHS